MKKLIIAIILTVAALAWAAGTYTTDDLVANDDIVAGDDITAANDVTAGGTVQGEHLYSTDDAVIDDDATVKGRILVGGVTDPYSLVEEAALQLNRTNADYIYSADSDDWAIFNTATDVTLDFWIRINPRTASVICSHYGSGDYWRIDFNTTYLGTVNYNITKFFDFGNLTQDNWTHIAMCKANGYGWGIYKDGTQLYYQETLGPGNTGGYLSIGALYGSASNTLGGHIDEFHISFSNVFGAAPNVGKTDTIDVPTSRHEVTDDTKVLLHFDGADGSTTFTDAAGRHTFTDYNTAQLDTGAYVEFGTAGADIVDLSIFSDQNDITLNHVTDSSINVLIEGDLEVQDDLFVQDNLSVDGDITDVDNITASATITGEQLTSTDDATIANTLTVTTINASGTITGDTLTDGTLIITDANITGAVDGTFSGTVEATKFALAIGSELEDDGAGFTQLSGDGTVDGGLAIALPQVAGSHFYYGFGGTEHHLFGTTAQIVLEDDGKASFAGSISANGGLAVTGNLSMNLNAFIGYTDPAQITFKNSEIEIGKAGCAVNIISNTTFGAASTDTTTHTGRMIVRTVTYETNMNTDVAGSTAEIVFCSTISRFFGCTSGGAAGSATWVALN